MSSASKTDIKVGWKSCKLNALDRLYEYEIGKDGCVGIFNEYECPEPYCGIEFIRIHFDNGKTISHNLNYIPRVELIPVEAAKPDETKERKA